MAMLGKRLWDDDAFVIASLIPKFGGINLGALQHPFANLFVQNLVSVDFTATGDLAVAGNADVAGELLLSGAASGLSINEGADARAGLATLVGGTVTVTTTAVATGDRILYARQTSGGTPGHLSAPTASIVNATSFVLNSSDPADTSTVYWTIVKPL